MLKAIKPSSVIHRGPEQGGGKDQARGRSALQTDDGRTDRSAADSMTRGGPDRLRAVALGHGQPSGQRDHVRMGWGFRVDGTFRPWVLDQTVTGASLTKAADRTCHSSKSRACQRMRCDAEIVCSARWVKYHCR